MGADSLHERFAVEAMPREIAPIVTRLNDLMARLEEGFERERRFSGYLAHELRTPLAAIRSTSEVALKWPEQATPEDHAAIARLAARLQQTVDSLLLLARAETISAEIVREAVTLRPLVEECAALHAERAREREVTLTMRLDETAVLQTDARLLRIIMTNLIANAVEYAPPRSEVTLACRATDRLFEVTNAAPALTVQDVPHLFERLWRKDAARSDAAHAGLGLSLAQNCARALGLVLIAELDSRGDVERVVARRKIVVGAHVPLMWEWEDVRMKLLLISIVGVMAAAAFAQQSPAPARRSPEQIFEFLDKDKNGTLSEAEFGALKDKMPSLRDRPDAVSAKFKELDKDHNGSLTLEEFRPMMTQGSRRPGATPAPAVPSTPAPSATPSTPAPARRRPMASPAPQAPTATPQPGAANQQPTDGGRGVLREEHPPRAGGQVLPVPLGGRRENQRRAGARHARGNPARRRQRAGSGAGQSQGEPAHRGDPLREQGSRDAAEESGREARGRGDQGF